MFRLFKRKKPMTATEAMLMAQNGCAPAPSFMDLRMAEEQAKNDYRYRELLARTSLLAEQLGVQFEYTPDVKGKLIIKKIKKGKK
jgi:hypothetical protein